MAYLGGDSWAYYATAQLLRKWQTADGCVVVPGAGRDGRQALQLGTLTRNFAMTGSTLIMGFALKPMVSGGSVPLVQLFSGSVAQVSVLLNSDLTISFEGIKTAPLVSGAWTYVEIKVDFHSAVLLGAVRIHLDGASASSVVGTNTDPAGTGSANMLEFGSAGSIGDFYLCDGSGPQNNDFLGNVTYAVLRPVAAGASGQTWIPFGTMVNWQSVDDLLVDDDATYNWTNATALEYYQMSPLPGSPASVLAVQWNAQARQVDASVTRLQSVLANSSAVRFGSTFSTQTAYVNMADVFELNPVTGLSWMPSDFASLQAGIALQSLR